MSVDVRPCLSSWPPGDGPEYRVVSELSSFTRLERSARSTRRPPVQRAPAGRQSGLSSTLSARLHAQLDHSWTTVGPQLDYGAVRAERNISLFFFSLSGSLLVLLRLSLSEV